MFFSLRPFLLFQQQRRRLIGLSNKRLNCCENRPQASTTCDQEINFRIFVPPLIIPSRCFKAEAPEKAHKHLGDTMFEFHVMHKESVRFKFCLNLRRYGSDEIMPGGYSQMPRKHHRKGLLSAGRSSSTHRQWWVSVWGRRTTGSPHPGQRKG